MSIFRIPIRLFDWRLLYHVEVVTGMLCSVMIALFSLVVDRSGCSVMANIVDKIPNDASKIKTFLKLPFEILHLVLIKFIP